MRFRNVQHRKDVLDGITRRLRVAEAEPEIAYLRALYRQVHKEMQEAEKRALRKLLGKKRRTEARDADIYNEGADLRQAQKK